MYNYDYLVAKIRRNRRWVIALTIIAMVLTVLLSTPIQVEIMGKTYIDKGGLHPVLIVLLVALCLLGGIIAYATVSLPLYTSMDLECDPEKQLLLNVSLEKPTAIDHICSTDYLYLGNFAESIRYAKRMLLNPKKDMVLFGLFNKARCEFFLGDYDAFRLTASRYDMELSESKLSAKNAVSFQKIKDVIGLLRAIADDDLEKINELCGRVEAWNSSKATECFVYYIKGVAAYKTANREEAFYRFGYVVEHCSKTVFAHFAKGYVESIK